MGVTAEIVAERYKVSREDQDAYALLSQQRYAAAVEQGFIAEEIVPMKVRRTVMNKGEDPYEPAWRPSCSRRARSSAPTPRACSRSRLCTAKWWRSAIAWRSWRSRTPSDRWSA